MLKIELDKLSVHWEILSAVEVRKENVRSYDADRDQNKDFVKDSIVETYCHFHHYGSRLLDYKKSRYSCSNWFN
jgi:hypothetical protein